MKIAFIGVGKLGFPVALAIESRGHEVRCFDALPEVRQRIMERTPLHGESGADALLDQTKIEVDSISHLVEWADLVFVAVQTPHESAFEGITELGVERSDFNYDYLRSACQEVASAAQSQHQHTTLVVVSTVLPGTMAREITPLLNEYIHLVYSPSFIAMGTVVADFLDPEFTLIGCDNPEIAEYVEDFFRTIHQSVILCVGIQEAELAKVAYNVLIGFKIAAVNTLAQICDGTGTDVDAVTNVLRYAKRRLWNSETYFTAGMGDGGGCHPRDIIALSWLARVLDMPEDPFEDIIHWREAHAKWLANILIDEATRVNLPIVLLGKSYKADTALVTGSPAILLGNMLSDQRIEFTQIDPLTGPWAEPVNPAVYFVATRHSVFPEMSLPSDSVVIDPWGYMKRQEGVRLVCPGRQNGLST